jgi:glycine/D-amino acid oxidase-like deaminating enzyme
MASLPSSSYYNSFLSFQLFTHTPCTEVTLAADGRSYCVSTPKGTVSAAHVVHATNAWAAHLLPGMQRKIVPVRVHMTAQRPGRNLGHGIANSPPWAGTRSFVFYSSTSMSAFDYLTQQPPADGASDAKDSKNITADMIYPVPAGELMFGGGARLGGRSEAAILDNIGIADDSQSDFDVEAYLGGALERYFALGWGEEAAESTNGTAKANDADSCWPAGRMKAAWSGIMGLSADEQPWVGRVPRFVSKRAEPKPQSKPSADSASVLLARPGEWISAGFTGEGMTHAWLAGVALAKMMLADPANDKSDSTPDASALPPQFVITEKRWKEADFEKNWAD